jgi:hypothetical protein
MICNPICKGMQFVTAPLSIFVREDEAPLELFYILYVRQGEAFLPRSVYPESRIVSLCDFCGSIS